MLNKQVKHFDFSLSFLPPSFSLYDGLSFLSNVFTYGYIL